MELQREFAKQRFLNVSNKIETKEKAITFADKVKVLIVERSTNFLTKIHQCQFCLGEFD